MNRRSKGKYYEKKARDLLKEQGFLCETKNYSRFQGQDFFSLFDILAVGKYTRLIQVKTNASHFYKARKDIKQWIVDNNVDNVSCEVWLKEPRKEWRIEIIDNKVDK
jgi:hypothetical protein